MKELFTDLHIHVGRTSEGAAVKVTGSRELTFPRILEEAAGRKGLDVVGIVDCASPGVLADIERMLAAGQLAELPGGGLRYRDRLTVILGVELGASVAGREAHFLSYLPTLAATRAFARALRPYVTNLQLSSQRARLDAAALLDLTLAADGFFVPAHVFTPHKGYYGHCAGSLAAGFDAGRRGAIHAVELGLSADTAMASRIRELDGVTFLSNSDAHSLARIGREYNLIRMADPSFASLRRAIAGEEGGVVANYGLDPRLGKYHRTWCAPCRRRIPLLSDRRCPFCGGDEITVGVFDRLEELADRPEAEARARAAARPPYVHQVPLEFVPGVGPRTLERLLSAFGTEMNILHRASREELARVASEPVAEQIVLARSGRLALSAGAGGRYGRVVRGEGGRDAAPT